MSGERDAKSKTEIAHAVAQWATEELGFRRQSTLVTAKGEEKIEAADVEPLLQGELVRILEQVTRHVVSSRRASYTRHKLAAYCTQFSSDTKLLQLPYVALRRDLKQLETRESMLSSEIESIELDNRAAIQSISDMESKRNAAEARIRELHLQILIKQAVSEKIRRLSKRLKVLVHEMTSNYPSTQATSSLDLTWSVDAMSSAHNQGAQSPSDCISRLMTQLQSANPDSTDNGQVSCDAFSGDAYKRRQLMVACVISCLKDLESTHVQMWSTVKALSARLAEGRSELSRKIELAASQLNLSVASAGGSALDFRGAILGAVVQDAVSQVGNSMSTFVPTLEAVNVRTWVADNHAETISDLIQSIEQVRALLAATRSAAQESAEYAANNVAPACEHLIKASHYLDMREAWNAVSLLRLQHVHIGSSNNGHRSADKLATRSSFMDSGRGKMLADICREAVVGRAGQTHEAAVANLREQLVRGLYRTHVLSEVNGELAANLSRIGGLCGVSSKVQGQTGVSSADMGGLSLHDAVKGACERSQAAKDEARVALAKWAEGSNAAAYLRMANESSETEEAITQLSDTSGRLFTELFAPWHKRDGVEYAEYLKQLKIARAGESAMSQI
ncbi:hypothetical protein GGI20_004855 [Coemansia sp. BCRC 34301]|nr:hypothetical protein GGI20_004855 [Coemansia sp. BCRC 34301]